MPVARVNRMMLSIGNSAEPRPKKVPPTDALTAETTPPRLTGALDIITVVCGVCTIAPPIMVSAITVATTETGVSSPKDRRISRLTASTERPATTTAPLPRRAAARPAPSAASADSNVAGMSSSANAHVDSPRMTTR